MSVAGIILLSVVMAAVLGPLLWLLSRMVMKAEPQYYVQSSGPAAPPTCPGCGYNLYHAVDRRCPECGRTFDLKELDMRLATWDGHVLRPLEQTQDKDPSKT